MGFLPRTSVTVTALTAALVASLAAPATAHSGAAARGIDPDRRCVHNGQLFLAPEGIAALPSCHATPDDLTHPRVAAVDPARTPEDLQRVRRTSLFDPALDFTAGSVAQRRIQAAPLAADSSAIAAGVGPLVDRYITDQFKGWFRTGASVGGGIHAHDNIPVYVVDSSNPAESTARFTSTDARVTSFPALVHYTTGELPAPPDFRPSDGGDRAAAIYDVATGLHREYFGLTRAADGSWSFASAGYLHAEPGFGGVGDNAALTLLQGTSSVVGMANSLTQIGAAEVKAGRIGHAVSVTFPDYRPTPAWPAKSSDGRVTDIPAPQPGQFARIPASFDVDAWAAETGADPITVMVVRAAQEYGVYVTDRNAFVTSFNFESPYGMGGADSWRQDPELAAMMGAYRPNRFPWDRTEWIAPGWTGTAADYEGLPQTAPAPAPVPTPAPSPTAPAPTPTPAPSPTAPSSTAPAPTPSPSSSPSRTSPGKAKHATRLAERLTRLALVKPKAWL